MNLRGAAALAVLALAACATLPPPQASAPSGMAALPGWDEEDHLAALALVRAVCGEGPDRASRACVEAASFRPRDDRSARRFLEAHFRSEPIDGEGLLTAYYAPRYQARRRPEGDFAAPVRPKPRTADEARDRAALERLPAPDALAWMRPEDLYVLQTQGSGVLDFPDGSSARAVFAGSNGRPYMAIAKPMADLDLIPRTGASASAVHAWLAANRGPHAQAIMDLNPRYVFFRLAPDDGGEPVGAAGAPLIAGRSLAVDPASHRNFELLWIDAEAPSLHGARPSYRRLAAAMDTGAAIRGPLRADLYLGRDAAAGDEAGAVRHALRLHRIVPAETAAR